MVIKQNHMSMRDELALFFDLPDHPTDAVPRDEHTTLSKAHGRIETRTLERYGEVYD